MKIVKILMLAAVGAICLTGCRSSRHAASESKKTDIQKVVVPSVTAMTAKLNLVLASGNKKIGLGGTYRLKRDEVIQINLTYTMLITVNVGTMELTPDYILILDRINKRYCKASYDEVPALGQAGIDFNSLQRVFWGEGGESPSKALTWTYDKWVPLGEGKFPSLIDFLVKRGNSSYKATFDLSNIKESENWETRTEVSSKYTPVSMDAVMNAIMSFTR